VLSDCYALIRGWISLPCSGSSSSAWILTWVAEGYVLDGCFLLGFSSEVIF
jgi:hypothetical protein